MNILGILLQPLEWQMEQGRRAVDPMGVIFDPNAMYPVKLDFEVQCGTAKVEQTGNFGLYATITVTSHGSEILRRDKEGGIRLAIEVTNPPVDDEETVTTSTLVCVAICDEQFDKAQPAAEVVV